MRTKPKLQVATDLRVFELNPLNRDIGDKPALMESMKEHGFMPSSPIQVVRFGSKLRVIRGHHRLHYARRLRLPVWYVIDESQTDLFDLEGDSSQRWTLRDFVVARAKSGDTCCKMAIRFAEEHGITLGASVSLLSGEGVSAGGGRALYEAKRGTFRVDDDLTHAHRVVGITDYLRTILPFKLTTSLVTAVSRACRVPEFDPMVFKHRITQCPHLMSKSGSHEQYIAQIEAVYNYAARGKRLALQFMADEIGRKAMRNNLTKTKGAA